MVGGQHEQGVKGYERKQISKSQIVQGIIDQQNVGIVSKSNGNPLKSFKWRSNVTGMTFFFNGCYLRRRQGSKKWGDEHQ